MAFLRWFLGRIILLLDAVFSPRPVRRDPDAQKLVDDALKGHSLYQYEACPFCVKVRRYMRGVGISMPLRDAKQEPYRAELLAGGGRLQVPCLRIERNGAVRWMYESGDIIAYLRDKIGG